MFLVLLLVGVTVGMTLAACGEGQQLTPTPGVTLIPSGTNNYVVVRDGTVIGTVQVTPNAPVTTFTATVLATSCATVETPRPIDTPTPSKYTYTILDETKLHTYAGRTGVSAYDLYQFYKNTLAANTSGWWWKSFAAKDHDFSIWDYFSLVSYFEASRQTRFAATMAEAGVRFYYGGSTGNRDASPESVLNWWAEFSESAAKQKITGVIEPEGEGIASEMSIVGNSFSGEESQAAAWTAGWDYNRPYNWGNLYAIPHPETIKIYKANSEALFVKWGTDAQWQTNRTFVIPSGCLWKKGDSFNDPDWQKVVCPRVERVE